MQKLFYKRDLPHWHPPGASIFLTWRLYGSLPAIAVKRLIELRRLLEREIPRVSEAKYDFQTRQYKKLFAATDSILDRAESGPLWLKNPQIAAIVVDALLSRYANLYHLWSFVVMANHIHVLLRPKLMELMDELEPVVQDLPRITKRLKGATAREANRLLGRTGHSFWEEECFDHWVRTDNEFYRVVTYIENNPVAAGLVKRAEDWPWSSASERIRRGYSKIKSLT